MVGRICHNWIWIKINFSFLRVSSAPIIISYVFSRCCLTSWNGLCCEFPLDHKEEEPEDAAHYSNYFSIQTVTPKPRQYQNSQQFFYKILFNGYLELTRVRELPIPKNKGNNYQWWAESKWVQKDTLQHRHYTLVLILLYVYYIFILNYISILFYLL